MAERVTIVLGFPLTPLFETKAHFDCALPFLSVLQNYIVYVHLGKMEGVIASVVDVEQNLII